MSDTTKLITSLLIMIKPAAAALGSLAFGPRVLARETGREDWRKMYQWVGGGTAGRGQG